MIASTMGIYLGGDRVMMTFNTDSLYGVRAKNHYNGQDLGSCIFFLVPVYSSPIPSADLGNSEQKCACVCAMVF